MVCCILISPTCIVSPKPAPASLTRPRLLWHSDCGWEAMVFTVHTHSLFTLSTAHHNMWTRMCYMLAMPLAPISLARRFAHMCLSRSLRQQARLNSRGGCQSPPCGFLVHVHCIPLSHTITHTCMYIHTCTCTLTVWVKCGCVRIFPS